MDGICAVCLREFGDEDEEETNSAVTFPCNQRICTLCFAKMYACTIYRIPHRKQIFCPYCRQEIKEPYKLLPDIGLMPMCFNEFLLEGGSVNEEPEVIFDVDLTQEEEGEIHNANVVFIDDELLQINDEEEERTDAIEVLHQSDEHNLYGGYPYFSFDRLEMLKKLSLLAKNYVTESFMVIE